MAGEWDGAEPGPGRPPRLPSAAQQEASGRTPSPRPSGDGAASSSFPGSATPGHLLASNASLPRSLDPQCPPPCLSENFRRSRQAAPPIIVRCIRRGGICFSHTTQNRRAMGR